MKHSEALFKLQSHAADLRALGVEALYLFGSTVRDEARADSDVDIFFDYAEDRPFSLLDLAAVSRVISGYLGQEADVMTRGSLHPALKDDITRTALRVF
ncbi:MAG: nucleotidyltransferase family protein [Rhodospirillales bacterium]